MHKVLAEQLKRAACTTTGGVDLDKLVEMVDAAYNEYERDLLQTERSKSFMIDELSTTHRRVLDAIDAIPSAISLFNADDRIVLWNRCYADLCREIGIEPVVGMHFREMLQAAISSGYVPDARGREQEWIAKRIADRKQPAHSEVQQLHDGRYVSVEEHRTSDGGCISFRTDITDLIQRKASFRLLFESNPVPMVVCENAALGIIAVNRAAVSHYGYDPANFLTKSIFDLDIEAKQNTCTRAWEKMEGGIERRHVKPDGTVMDVSVYHQRLTYEGEDATLFAIIDLTEQKRADREIRETREFLNTVIDHIPTSIVVKGAHDLRYILVNRAAEELLGVSRADVVGKYAHDFLPRERADGIVERDRLLMESGREIVLDELQVTDFEGRARHVRAHRVIVNDLEGQPRYLLGLVEDTTERKAAEVRIAHLQSRSPD